MLKKLALAVMIVCGAAAAQNVTAPATLDPGQIYNTGNIVQPTTTTTGSTWVNGVYQNQLTCWAWGDPGYCGPDAIVRPGNNINFSFGTTDLYQVRAIASVLPGNGSGLRVNGYNFGFNAKNGNGWDGGGLDTLSAYVNFYSSNGEPVRNDYYNLNYQFNWTTFNYSKTFDSPFAAKDLSTVRYGFVGRDNNFWAGPYGPEITNVSFSLKYSVDPCAKDPLYSPTCPGYMDALNKLLPPPTTVSAPVVEAAASTPAATTATVESIVPTTSTAPAAPTATLSSTAPAATTNTATSAASVVSSPSTATRESSGGGGTAAGLAVVARNQQREQAIAAQAVQTATATAAAAAAAAQQEAANVAAQAVAGSTGSAATLSGPAQSASGQGVRLGTAQAQTSQVVVPLATASTTNAVGISFSNSASMSQQSQSTSAQTETAFALPNNALLDRSNPLNAFFEPRVSLPQSSNNNSTGPAVNRNAGDNEAAGGVSIATMAVAPMGYGDYLNFTLRDAAFYAPREVYRNQRTVDNARALRQLTNDSRHREMVEQQYRR